MHWQADKVLDTTRKDANFCRAGVPTLKGSKYTQKVRDTAMCQYKNNNKLQGQKHLRIDTYDKPDGKTPAIT